jgi:dipeptidase D
VTDALKNLEPALLWKYFGEMSRVPRCSKQEEKILNYVKGVADGLDLDFSEDRAGNLVVRKPAVSGRENVATTVIQGHLDMVCEKNEGTLHDFSSDPIRLLRQDGMITADGTTLGADNGIGVAAGLAVMAATDIAHGPLEFLFTVDEETGLTGAFDLEPHLLNGRRMINTDSEEEGAVYIGCSGGLTSMASNKVSLTAPTSGKKVYDLKVYGLKGGHSGLDIHFNRGNAIKLLARILWTYGFGCELEIASLSGGSKQNAIPREARALFYMDPSRRETLIADLEVIQAKVRSELGAEDPGFTVSLTQVDARPEKVMTAYDARAVINFLYCSPHGVLAMSPAITGLVQTSTNTAVLEMTDGVVKVRMSHRSAVESSKRDVGNMIASYCEMNRFALEQGSGYPGWQPNLDSALLATSRKVHEKLFGQEPALKAIHAGLECGLIGEKFPGMDMISFGPTIINAHSPDEAVDIASVETFWKFLTGLLEEL